MLILHYDMAGVTGSISRELLATLPVSIKEEFLSAVTFRKTTDEFVFFAAECGEASESLFHRLEKYCKNKIHSETRQGNVFALSEGVYEQSDLREIFDIQEGLCYYTGEPISWAPRSLAVDHIIPVVDGGSSWPGNLALTVPKANREKAGMSKQKYFALLGRRYGVDWLATQREYCRKVDARRREIDKRRKRQVTEHLAEVEQRLRKAFPGVDIEYHLVGGTAELSAQYTTVMFPAGFLRQNRLSCSVQYLEGIIRAVLGR